MRIVFLAVTAMWVFMMGFVLWNVREFSGASGWYAMGGLTFSLGVCAILEGLRKIEKK